MVTLNWFQVPRIFFYIVTITVFTILTLCNITNIRKNYKCVIICIFDIYLHLFVAEDIDTFTLGVYNLVSAYNVKRNSVCLKHRGNIDLETLAIL